MFAFPNLIHRHVRRCSTLISYQEMQNKSTMRNYSSLTRMTQIKKTILNGSTQTFTHCQWENKLIKRLGKLAVSTRAEHTPIQRPTIPFLGICICSPGDMYKDIINNTINKSKIWKTTQIPPLIYVNKLWRIHALRDIIQQ